MPVLVVILYFTFFEVTLLLFVLPVLSGYSKRKARLPV